MFTTKKYFHVNTLHTHYKNAHAFEKKNNEKNKKSDLPTLPEKPYVTGTTHIFFFGLMIMIMFTWDKLYGSINKAVNVMVLKLLFLYLFR